MRARLLTLATAVLALGLVAAALSASPALAAFPYGAQGATGDYSQYRLTDGQFPGDLDGSVEWMYSATPGQDNAAYAADPRELNGVRGAHVVDKTAAPDVAWETTTGRPDVTISVLDSGIKWDDRTAMVDVRKKMRLSKGELPMPRNDRSTPLEGAKPCPDYKDEPADYDANGDGVFNVLDYACDSRVEKSKDARAGRGQPRGQGPDDLLDPQDILIAFTNNDDGDSNGYKDDIVGWDFLDNDNDAYDDVQYGHGTGEIRDSTAEADNKADGGGSLGTCPNCTSIPLRVGDSFVADVNRFAQATIYATDNDVSVVQEALGTLNNSTLATQSIDYAYNHGVTVIASAADEAAQHNNWPSSNPHVILVNSVTKYASQDGVPAGAPSYLAFNGCTNFNSKITLAIPSVSCSSDATGRGSGMAGLVYSAALNAKHDKKLEPHAGCKRADAAKTPCLITANEVRQLMASGGVGGKGLADDVNFAGADAASCATRTPGCTDPFFSAPSTNFRLPGGPGQSYPARAGHDQFYGYGRVNMNSAVKQAASGVLPPEAEIDSPDWYSMIDPSKGSLDVRGQVGARGRDYSCRVYVAPGSYPNNSSADAQPAGDFKPVSASGPCNGSTRNGAGFDGVLATLDLTDLQSRFPAATDFGGPIASPNAASHNGRPNTDPYGFVVKVVVSTKSPAGTPLTGEDRRNLRLHKDSEMLPGFPRDLGGDGASSPAFADLDGDNRKELVIGGSDGFVHAYNRDGSELAGWPVRGDQPPLHTGGRGFASGEVSGNFGGAILASVAAHDIDHDGAPEVVAADLEGKVYVWDSSGHRLQTLESNPAYSGKPSEPFGRVRQGHRFRTQHGFIGSPVLADVDRNDGGRKEIVAAGLDRHVYAWNDDGSRVPGFPVLLVDRTKVSAIDSATHAPTFKADIGPELDQGAIVDTPAVEDIQGDKRPEIVVGTNEEYAAGDDGGLNAANAPNGFVLNIAGTALGAGNSRLYAIKPTGDSDGNPMTDDFEIPGAWPAKVGLLMTQVLPVVGEGVTGAPIIGPANCGGNTDQKIGVSPDAGPAYIFKADGTSCLGKADGGKDVTLQTSGSENPEATDTAAVVPAFGHPAFGKLGPAGDELSYVSPALGLQRALDIALPEYQPGQDFLGAWTPSAGGQFRPGFPGVMDDLQFLTGPSIADLDGNPGEEIVAASASLDLEGFNAAGKPIDPRHWPKLTSDWVVANPLVGSWSDSETDPKAKKTLFEVTRSGFMTAYSTKAPPCSPGSWPRFHHDEGNTGSSDHDAISPGKPGAPAVNGSALGFTAPGDDLLCGKADHYEVYSADEALGDTRLRGARQISGAPAPAAPGTRQQVLVPPASGPVLAIRAVDEQGNVGRFAVVDLSKPSAGGGSGPGGSGGNTNGGGNGGGNGQGNASGCLNSRGGARGKRLGPAHLGRTQRRQRKAFRGKRLRSRGGIDRYCATGGGTFRIAYPTRRLNRGLSRSTRRRIRSRAVLALTSSKRFSVRGIKPGASVRTLRRRLHGERRVRVGRNVWYLAPGKRVRLVFKARGKRVTEVGIGDRRLTRTSRADRHFLRAWQRGG